MSTLTLDQAPPLVVSIADAAAIREAIVRYARRRGADRTIRARARAYAIGLRKEGHSVAWCIAQGKRVVDAACPRGGSAA